MRLFSAAAQPLVCVARLIGAEARQDGGTAPDLHDRQDARAWRYAAHRAAIGAGEVAAPTFRGHLYLGIRSDGRREVFSSAQIPERAAYPQYASVVGPFRTHQGAEYMALHGEANSRCQTVADAEQLAAQAAQTVALAQKELE